MYLSLAKTLEDRSKLLKMKYKNAALEDKFQLLTYYRNPPKRIGIDGPSCAL